MSYADLHLRNAEADLFSARRAVRKAKLPRPFNLEVKQLEAQITELEERVKRLRRCGF